MIYFYFICMGGLPICISVDHMPVPPEARRGIGSSGPLQKQQVLLTSKPFLQPHIILLKKKITFYLIIYKPLHQHQGIYFLNE